MPPAGFEPTISAVERVLGSAIIIIIIIIIIINNNNNADYVHNLRQQNTLYQHAHNWLKNNT